MIGRSVADGPELVRCIPFWLLFRAIRAAVLRNLVVAPGATLGRGVQLSAGGGKLGLAPLHDLDVLTHQEEYFAWQAPKPGVAPRAVPWSGRTGRTPAGRARTAVASSGIGAPCSPVTSHDQVTK